MDGKTKISVILLCFIIGIISVKADCTNLSNAEVFLTFDGNYTDLSGNGYTVATNVNTTLNDTNYKFGTKSAQLSSGYMILDYDGVLASGARTISFWYYGEPEEGREGTYKNAVMVSYGTGATAQSFEFMQNEQDTDGFYDDFAIGAYGWLDQVITTKNVNWWDSTWHHLVVTCGSPCTLTELVMYYDGVLYAGIGGANTYNTGTTANVNIGKHHRDPNSRSFLNIDDFGFYDYKFTQDDVNALYNEGTGCSPYTSEFPASNNAPTINEVALNPIPIYANTSVSCIVNATDADAENLTLEYIWYKDGSVISGVNGNYTEYSSLDTNATISELGSGNYSKGEVVNCTVTAYDGTDYSASTSAILTVQNLLPQITSTSILNSTAYTNTTLIGQCTAIDGDTDSITYSYNWYNSTDWLWINSTELGSGNFTKGDDIQFQCNVTDDASTFLILNSSIVTISNTMPDLSAISYETSSGATIYYLQTLNKANFTFTDIDSDSFSDGDIYIYKPDGSLQGIYTATSISGDIYGATLSITLDSIGTWTINATASDGTDNASATLDITVNSIASPNVIDGFFGYDTDGIPSDAELLNISTYSFNLYGFEINYSTMTEDWESLKSAINYTFIEHDGKVFIEIYYDHTDYSDSTVETAKMENISDLTSYPYVDAVQFMVIRQNESQADLVDFTDDLAEELRSESANRFPIYSNYHNNTFDENYVTNWTMIKYALSTQQDFINQEMNYARNSTSLTRIYSGGNETLKQKAKDYNDDIISNLRSDLAGSTNITNENVAQLNNHDIIVYNNQSTSQSSTIDYTDAYTKDLWDYTNKRLYKNISGSVSITVADYGFTMVFADSFDKVVMDDNSSGTLYYDSGSIYNSMNYTPSGGDSTLSIVSAYDARTELWNPDFGLNDLFFISYEQWGYNQIIDIDTYDIIVLAKGEATNSPSDLNLSFNVSTNTDLLDKIYGYISVADYNNSNSTGGNITDCTEVNEWETDKITETYNWTDSYDVNVFIDGFDMGYSITPSCFEERIKRVSDAISTNKQKQVIFNSYTIYQTISNYGDYIMRESCFSRWGGTVGSPTYSYEDFSLMLANSKYLSDNNKPVLCMAFGDINDYDKMAYDYHAFAVLYGADGSNLFRYGQPNFQTQREIRVADFGDMLQSDWVNNSDVDISRRYEKGIVHINPLRNETFDNGKYYWFDDNKEVNELELTVKAQVYGATCSAGTGIIIQMHNGTDYIGDQYTIDPCTDIGAVQWSTSTVQKAITSEYAEHGHYYVTFRPVSRVEATGTNLWITTNTVEGIHSWYDSTADNPPIAEADWSAYARNGAIANQYTSNIYANLLMNKTYASSIDDDVNNIEIVINSSDNKHNITVSSTNSYEIDVWTYAIDFTVTTFSNLSYFNGTDEICLEPVNNTDCDTSDPTFKSQTINGSTFKSCYEQNGTDTIIRVVSPSLSSKIYIYDAGNDPPTINSINITPLLNLSYFSDYNITANITDDYGISSVYLNYSGLNQEGISCWEYNINGSCEDDTPIEVAMTLQGTGIYNNSLRPDNIYLQQEFGSDSLFWNNAREAQQIYLHNYQIFHFTNNFTMTENASFWLEFDINNSKATKDAQVYLMGNGNSITDFNSDWRNNSDVELICSVGKDEPYHHSHTQYSNHRLCRLVSGEDGLIGSKSINITEEFWMIIYLNENSASKAWTLGYRNQTLCNNTQNWYIGNAVGWSTTYNEGCPDTHFHISRDNDGATFNVLATDNIGQSTNLSETFYFGELPNFPPNKNIFITPENSTYYGDINVTWGTCLDPNAGDTITYNLTLRNKDSTFNSTIMNISSNVSYIWDSNTTSDDTYDLLVFCCDQLDACSNFSLTDAFGNITIDNPNCGDGNIDTSSGEECEGTTVDGLTCADYGFTLGQLQCIPATCRISTAGCGIAGTTAGTSGSSSSTTSYCEQGIIDGRCKCGGVTYTSGYCYNSTFYDYDITTIPEEEITELTDFGIKSETVNDYSFTVIAEKYSYDFMEDFTLKVKTFKSNVPFDADSVTVDIFKDEVLLESRTLNKIASGTYTIEYDNTLDKGAYDFEFTVRFGNTVITQGREISISSMFQVENLTRDNTGRVRPLVYGIVAILISMAVGLVIIINRKK